ncbi:MAG: hypothetical protein KDA35_10980, partial [Hyphomonadaceae bacterium]|nr:hypothetical protein [Hyphomonadaceae bacterium]
SIDNGVGSVTPVAGGSLSVSPATTTTYTLTLTGPGGVLTKQATVTVTAVPPTGTFAATLPSIFPGGSATLSWTSSGATSASIDNGVGSVTPVAGGSVSVSPSATTTYTLTLTGPGGIVTRQVTVSVDPGFNQTIAITGSGPVNLRTLASTAGYNGQQNANVTFTLGSGVTITGTPGELADGGPGIDSGGWPNELNTIVIALQIDGTVYGGGGGGGDGTQGSLGGAGGDAIYCRLPLSITVNSGGVVRAGGGGGKGGVTSPPPLERWGGGGGGGGAPNGLGGTGGTGTTSDGQPGSPGTVSGGGAGGAPAGAGATAGSAGGAFATSGGGGSAAGYAIRKNGFTVPVTNNGTITGTVG